MPQPSDFVAEPPLPPVASMTPERLQPVKTTRTAVQRRRRRFMEGGGRD